MTANWPRVVNGIGLTHDGCNYAAPVLQTEDGAQFWVCDKCGQGGEQPTPAASSPAASPTGIPGGGEGDG